MRSSKSRSRSKSNRSRSMGNVVNRVFDSSGPEGKVRGTPQQIIDKYAQLARDAQLNNDRVVAENFQQHGEHYTRLLGEAQREADSRREQQERENRDRGNARGEGQGDGDEGPQNGGDPGAGAQPDTGGEAFSASGDDENGLVETPETRQPSRKRRRNGKAQGESGVSDDSDDEGDDSSAAAAE